MTEGGYQVCQMTDLTPPSVVIDLNSSHHNMLDMRIVCHSIIHEVFHKVLYSIKLLQIIR